MIKGYEILTMALSGEIKPKTIVRTKHEIHYLDSCEEYDYYIFHADNMFHRCNKKGKLGSKYQDRFLQYKVLQKDFEVHAIPHEEFKSEKNDEELPQNTFEMYGYVMGKIVDSINKGWDKAFKKEEVLNDKD